MFFFSNRNFEFKILAVALLAAGALFLSACGGGGDGGGGDGGGGGTDPLPTGVISVDPAATGTGDGSTWANAFTNLQAGVDAAVSGNEVWVKQGTYIAASATATVLTMKDGVAVYGGFAGSELLRAGRSTNAALTILSGDFNGDDGTTGQADNSYHVVAGVSNATLEGFTVTAGNAVGTTPDLFGGGMYNASVTALDIVNVIISGNTGYNGGGIYNKAVTSTMSNVTFLSNTATGSGAGMHNESDSNATLTDVNFTSNTAVTQGGGLNNFWSIATLTNVTFTGNTATGSSNGGGMYNGGTTASATLNNVAFTGNSANQGGGMIIGNASATLDNVTFTGNSAVSGGGLLSYNAGATPVLTNVTFSGNTASSSGGGMYSFNGATPTLTNVTFSGNTAVVSGGGMFHTGSNPTLTNVTFSTNTAPDGGAIFNENSSPVLTNVTISGNTAATNGGGIYNNNSTPVLTNVTISGNTAATNGGGIYNNNVSTSTLINVTISGNTAATSGGGIYNNNVSTSSLINVAFWGNTGAGPDVIDVSNTSVITYSCAQQDIVTGYGGTNVTLGADPFVMAASGEVFLNQGSGCVDAGLDAAADDATYGFVALGLPNWPTLTTSLLDAALDADTETTVEVDIGRHYDPAQAWVKTASVDATNITWTTNGATACDITNSADATVLTVASADLASGSVAHGQGATVVLTMTCQGTVGLPAAAEVTVP